MCHTAATRHRRLPAAVRNAGADLDAALPMRYEHEIAEVRDLLVMRELLASIVRGRAVAQTTAEGLISSNGGTRPRPDWGSVQIAYSGPQIDQEGLLQYIVSFRNHHEFHEQCVERIFMDLWTRCKPIKLTVYARYTRRGGLDINPLRTSHPQQLPVSIRTARQ